MVPQNGTFYHQHLQYVTNRPSTFFWHQILHFILFPFLIVQLYLIVITYFLFVHLSPPGFDALF